MNVLDVLNQILQAIRGTKENDRHFVIDYPIQQYTESGTEIVANCNGILFINDGGSSNNAIINGFPVPPGAAFSPNDHKNEWDETTYKFTFAAGATVTLYVMRKRYTK